MAFVNFAADDNRVKRAPWLLAAVVLSGACRTSDSSASVASFESSILAAVGGEDTLNWLARPVAARLGPASHVVVLDMAAPFVRGFRANGESVRRFLGEGEGPNEARRPIALAVIPTGLIVVAAENRLLITDTAGQAISTLQLRYPVVSISRGCGTDLLVYGPERIDSTTYVWLRAYRTHDTGLDSIAPRTLLVSEHSVASRGYGKPVLASDGRSVALLDEYRQLQTLMIFSCKSGYTITDSTAIENKQERRLGEQSVIRGGFFFSGVAVTDAGVLWLESHMPEVAGPDAIGRTDIRLVRHDGGIRTLASVQRVITLLDGTGNRLLLSDITDLPRVLVVSVDSLLYKE